ncbi:zinc-binding dehydrogenase [Gottfriedia acidiceleris]|uniref:zinc-binding dehydrogenase n=1 Tax=Gottfriedia acidiceleris TaxID=371036 RepID=UPI00267D4FD0
MFASIKEQSFKEEVLKATNNQGVDVILDFIGASYWEKNLKSLKTDGRWIMIGILGGSEVNKVNLMEILQKRVQLKATLITPRSDEYKKELTKEFVQKAMPLFDQNKIKAIVDQVFRFEDIQNPHKVPKYQDLIWTRFLVHIFV